ncbi:MAG: CheR family methyltransferase [Bacillota bacterium]
MDFDSFKEQMMRTFGLDLNSYKEAQLKRRLENLMYKQNAASYKSFFEMMSRSRQSYEMFLDNLTINVSEFFRDTKRWDELKGKYLPGLLARKGTLKIWSAACANGCEPYSLAILLDELTPGKNHSIEATDLDKKILEAARQGRYKADAVRGVNKKLLALYFQQEKDEYMIPLQKGVFFSCIFPLKEIDWNYHPFY